MTSLFAGIPATFDVDWALLLMRIQWSDVVLLVFFTFGVFYGLVRGLTRVLPRLIAVLLAQTLTVEYYELLAQYIGARVPVSVDLLRIGAFAVIAVCVLFSVRFIFQILMLIASIEFKSIINSVIGALAGGCQFVLLMSLMVSFLLLLPMPFFKQSFSDRSLSGPYIAQLTPQVHSVFGKYLSRLWPTE